MAIILFIDTTNNTEITVSLKVNGKKHTIQLPVTKQKAQVVLPLLEKLLHEQKLTLQDITAIEVNPGPGSFTGVRVGITIANALGFLLNIPVNEKKIGEMVEAVYN